MNDYLRITSARFHHYKAFREFSISIDRFNILVGPNNAGKSTILGAFRILAEAMRKAKAKSPVFVEGPNGHVLGYEVNLEKIPVATENVFHNYDEDQLPLIRFRVSNGNHLILFFPRRGLCNLICETTGRAIKSPSAFRQQFGFEIGFVPVLGPVEHDEQVYQKEAAREAVLTHRASRNFRNIWHHYPEHFDDFRTLLRTTWPGMDIKPPEVDASHEKPLLRMFCPEERIDREIFWAGFGFQVWCQMLTFMVVNRDASLFIIDEPDIYLHSDLQRQLVSALRVLGPDILIATHSTEIISEADPDEILLVTKKARSAQRIGDPTQLQSVFNILGSNLNPVLTQLARSKKVVFIEGKDFQIIARLAAKLDIGDVAVRSKFAVVPTEGFNPAKAKFFKQGVEATIDAKIAAAIVFDRDYRADEEVKNEISEMKLFCDYAHIHSRKELENFLLVPSALNRAIARRIDEQNKRTGKTACFEDSVEELLQDITDALKNDVLAQYLKRRQPVAKAAGKSLDDTTVTSQLLASFEAQWKHLSTRLDMVPGKVVLSKLNSQLQAKWNITVTPNAIIEAMQDDEVPDEIKKIIISLAQFANGQISKV